MRLTGPQAQRSRAKAYRSILSIMWEVLLLAFLNFESHLSHGRGS